VIFGEKDCTINTINHCTTNLSYNRENYIAREYNEE